MLPAGTAYDLFRGTAASARDEVETYPTQLAAKVTFGAKTHPEVAVFSPDGTMLATGSTDGFIEVRCLQRSLTNVLEIVLGTVAGRESALPWVIYCTCACHVPCYGLPTPGYHC
jgi:hypothetical protein